MNDIEFQAQKISDFFAGKLGAWLHNLRIVGIGEIVHGSGSLHFLAGRFIKNLVEGAFQVIALEAPDTALRVINQKCSCGLTIVQEDLRDLYFVWQTSEVLDVLNVVSHHNKLNPQDTIQVRGFDTRQPAEDFAILLNAFPLVGLREMFGQLGVDQSIGSFRECEKKIQSGELKVPESLCNEILDSLVEVEAQRPAPEVKRSLAALRVWLNDYYETSIGASDGFTVRDRGMAKNVTNLSFPNKKVVVWSHLAHLIFDSSKVQSNTPGLSTAKLMGSVLKSEFDKDFGVIALLANTFFHEGKVVSQIAQENSDAIESALNSPLEIVSPNWGRSIEVGSPFDEIALAPSPLASCLGFTSQVRQFDIAVISIYVSFDSESDHPIT